MRRKYPDWERPYKVPGKDGLFIVGILVGIWIIIGSCLELDLNGYISLAIYFAIGIVVNLLMDSYRKKNPEEYKLITLTPEDKDKAGEY